MSSIRYRSKKYTNVSRGTYSLLEVRLRRLLRKTYEDKFSVVRIYLLYLQTVLITAGPSVTI